MRPAARPHFSRLAVGARVFGVVVICGPVLWSGGSITGLAVLVLVLTWAAVSVAESWDLPAAPLMLLEGALIGTMCGLTFDQTTAVLATLAVPPFTAALRRGLYGAFLMLVVEVSFLLAVGTLAVGPFAAESASGMFTWSVTGFGLGLIGTFLHSSLPTIADPLRPYRDAQGLIRELIDLSGSLSSGLDAVSLADSIAGIVRDELPLTAIAVQVPQDDHLTPLLLELDPEGAEAEGSGALARTAAGSLRPERAGHAFAIPLVSDSRLVAIVTAALSPRVEPEALQLDRLLDRLADRLEPLTVQLDTALMFIAFRDAATANERRRLAREMHDGIAQDIASLGYLVDNLAAAPASPEQAAQLKMLRDRVTTVVSDVRQSVKGLRTEVGESPSLGAAIAALARHLSDSSGIPIRVTADERTARLRPEVEAELLRIAQEAITNAVKHSGATLIDVRCVVAAPSAEIRVQDNGRGLGQKRADSQGLEVMRERAVLISASLTIVNAQPHGTMVTVRLPARASASSQEVTDGQRVNA